MGKSCFITIIILLAASCSRIKNDQHWAQFRGFNGSGIASGTAFPPTSFGNHNLEWEAELPRGVSSPIIWGDKIFVTGYIDTLKELQTICLNRKDGKTMWITSVIPDTVERVSQVSSPAQSTPVTDGERVISYFGSSGVFCYDLNGKKLWRFSMACNTSQYGSATSPIIAEDRVILLLDFGSNRKLLAINKLTGELIWVTPLETSVFRNVGGQSTPCIKDSLIIIQRIGEIDAFSLKDGSEIWNYKILTTGCSSPIIADDLVIVSCWHPFGEDEARGQLPDFDFLLKDYDKDKDRLISKNEIPTDLMLYTRPEIRELPDANNSVRNFFGFFDKNNDQLSTREEWESGRNYVQNTFYKPAGLVALNLFSKGAIKEDQVIWKVVKNMPEVPTPIFYNKRIYTIKDGGILTCIDPQSGEVIYSKKLSNPGSYISSPVAANNNLYLISSKGKMKIIKASDKYEEAGSYDIKENVMGTPAVVGKYFYIRTRKGLRAYVN